jgi:hypothetical protein
LTADRPASACSSASRLLGLAQDLPHPSFLERSLLEDARHEFLHQGLNRFGEAWAAVVGLLDDGSLDPPQ